MGLIFNGNGDVIKAVDGSLTVEGLDIGGSTNIEAGIGTFSGNLNVGGVLTYEDVKNVDSVGIVTARTGVKVLAGGLNVVGASYFNNNIVATASTATSVTVTDESSDTLTFPLFVTASVSGGLVQTENLQPQAGSNFYFNSSTGALSATSINGNIVGGTISGTTGTLQIRLTFQIQRFLGLKLGTNFVKNLANLYKRYFCFFLKISETLFTNRT